MKYPVRWKTPSDPFPTHSRKPWERSCTRGNHGHCLMAFGFETLRFPCCLARPAEKSMLVPEMVFRPKADVFSEGISVFLSLFFTWNLQRHIAIICQGQQCGMAENANRLMVTSYAVTLHSSEGGHSTRQWWSRCKFLGFFVNLYFSVHHCIHSVYIFSFFLFMGQSVVCP